MNRGRLSEMISDDREKDGPPGKFHRPRKAPVPITVVVNRTAELKQ